ncbi:MAG: low affinity iron permease family protein [Parachlamydia sp.]|jgi:low affinity Fe/Cu permease|nr:low affinity iron permease family protein [Parachlamydia sp.]
MKKKSALRRFLTWSARAAGNPMAFVFAFSVLIFWGIIGLIAGFSDTWILIIDTLATINASLMVYIIQYTQIREIKAMHLKLDGIIQALEKAENQLIAIEEAEEEELETLRKILIKSPQQ